MSYVANSLPGTDGPVQKLGFFILFGQKVDVIGLRVEGGGGVGWGVELVQLRGGGGIQTCGKAEIQCVKRVRCQLERPRRV